MGKIKTLPNTWKTSLHLLLKQPGNKPGVQTKIALMGIGNNLRSDDAAGILVARALIESGLIGDLKHVLVMDAGHAPENRTAELRRFAPDVVLLIDAAEMGETPGTIRWIQMEDLDGMSASTHSMPLSMLANYLTLELHCEVALLGIQPGSNDFGETVSAEVLQATDEIVKAAEKSLC
jgi:hydrogenase 3 maturation protease